jgi:hypothetical protein
MTVHRFSAEHQNMQLTKNPVCNNVCYLSNVGRR